MRTLINTTADIGSMASLPDRGDDLLYDTLVYAATALIAYGLGSELDRWLANDAYAAPVFYAGFLVVIYAKWVLAPHR